MRLRCDPGDLARLRTQPAAGPRESRRAKPGYRGRSVSQQFLFLNSRRRSFLRSPESREIAVFLFYKLFPVF